MKKTLTINISGTVFHIDEDAYDMLKTYLLKISNHFKIEEGGDEIIHDIEARIAELFTTRTANTQGVVNVEMVNEIIEVMGLPEDFAVNDEDNSGNQGRRNYEAGFSSTSKNKRLYRDPESRVVGGVCSGLAHYLKMDKALVRILFFILILVTSGAGLLAYFILWVAVPKARTTSQKLEMKGEDINIDSIGKSVKEEFSEMKDNFDKYKNSDEFKKGKEYARKAGQNAQYAGREAASVITKVFGAIILFAGFIALVGLSFGILFTSKTIGLFPDFIDGNTSGFFLDNLYTGSFATTILIASFLLAGIPLLLLIYAGTKMLFNYYSNSRNIVLSALGVWIIALIVAIGSAFGAVDGFSSEASVSDNQELIFSSDTIYIQVDRREYEDLEEMRFGFNNVKVMMKGDEDVLMVRPRFTIEPTSENKMELRMRKKSRGNNYKQAKENAENIQFNYTQSGTQLVLDPYFRLEKKNKWRSQELRITLKLPEGKVVYLNDNLLPVINNIENTSNTWDGDMTGEYWQMKPAGLTLVQVSK